MCMQQTAIHGTGSDLERNYYNFQHLIKTYQVSWLLGKVAFKMPTLVGHTGC